MIRILLLVVVAALACARDGHAFSSASVRFYGTGGGTRVDRIKVPVEPPTPVDVGAGDFTIEFWMLGTLADNVEPLSGYRTGNTLERANVDWIYGNIIVDRDLFGSGPDFGASIHRTSNGDGVLRFGTEDGSPTFGQHTLQGRTPVLDGQWHHVALVRERSTGLKRIYVDGVLDVVSSSGASTSDLSYPNGRATQNPDSDPFLVFASEKHGFDGESEFPSFTGWLDDIRVWSVARSAAEIAAARSQALPGNTPGLVLYLRLEEGAGTVLANATGGNTATLYSGVPGEGEWRSEIPPGAGPTTTTTSSSSTSSSSTSTTSSSSTSTSRTSTSTARPTTTTSTSTTSTAPPPPTTSTTTSTSSTTTTTAAAVGLVAAWAFGENAGPTVADAAGGDNPGPRSASTARTTT
jgi:hypothetical protein